MKHAIMLLLFLSTHCRLFDLQNNNATQNLRKLTITAIDPFKILTLGTPVRVTLSDKHNQYYKVTVNITSQTPTNTLGFRFVIFQAHSQYRPLATSLVSSRSRSSGQQQIGSDTGVLKIMSGDEKQLDFYTSSVQNRSVASLLMAVAGREKDPVPGACCLTCSLEFDPNINVSYNFFKTTIHFSRANIGWLPGQPQPACDDGPAREQRLVYSVYYYYLDERDFAEESLFEGIEKMSTLEGIIKYGNKIGQKEHLDSTIITMETASAQGVVFNVIASDPKYGTRSVYAPAVTYACQFTSTIDGCFVQGATTTLVFCIIGAVVGLFMCFAGFKFYVALLFVCGTVEVWFILYVLLTRFLVSLSYRDRMLTSSIPALVGGALLVIIERYSKYLYIGMLNVALVLGLLLTSIVFYTPLTQLHEFSSDTFYIVTFVSAVVAIAVISIFFPKPAILLCSSVGGAYGVMVISNFFVGGNMQHVFISVILRMTIDGYGHSYMRRPYQRRDMILTGCGACLMVTGIIFQYFTTRKKEFNPDGSDLKALFREGLLASGNFFRRKLSFPSNDHAPLLSNYVDDGLGNVFYDDNQRPQYAISPSRAEKCLPPDYSITPSFSEDIKEPSFTTFKPRTGSVLPTTTIGHENPTVVQNYGAINNSDDVLIVPVTHSQSGDSNFNSAMSNAQPNLSTFKTKQEFT